MNVIKRNGKEVQFQKEKIVEAIQKASDEVSSTTPSAAISRIMISAIATEVSNKLSKNKDAISISDIQDEVENTLMQRGYYMVAKAYIKYRHKKDISRGMSDLDKNIMTIVDGENETAIQENSNKNPKIAATQRDYIAGEVSRDLTNRALLPKDISQAHIDGLIHFHDADYFLMHIFNCCLVNMEDILQNGTVINGTLIEKPHTFAKACNIATQVMAQVASNQYGGQSVSLASLAPFVNESRNKIRNEYEKELRISNVNIEDLNEEDIKATVEYRLRQEIKNGVQTIQYQINTLMTTNGQTPFVTIFMYLNEVEDGSLRDDLAIVCEEVFKQRIQGVKNESGAWITPSFPKLIYVLEENNIREDSKYWWLTELAAKCTAKRMVPDYISEKKMFEFKVDENGNGNCYACMGCRSFLTTYLDENRNPKYYGRFNQGVCTINLVDVALSANKDFDKFWEIFDERLELCHRALRIRHERLLGTASDISPIHWQHGAIARLKPGEKIDKLLYGGYSTISLGYAGLYECVLAMTGKSHTDPDAKPFALEVMQHMNDKCDEWKEAENIAYSLYGSPIESTTYKFAKCLKKRFGVIDGITDKNYVTNSYHVNVTEPIDAFSKLSFEADFQKLSPGGMISYVETPNLTDNIDAVLSVMKFIYDNIMYAELNTKCDYCKNCGFDGEIEIVEDENGKLIWKCPQCGNTDKTKMNVVRRTCGYLGSNDWNQGRVNEFRDRYVHIGNGT